jgi:predicted nucleic acid-binding protein
VIVDSSVWIDHLRDTQSGTTQLLRATLRQGRPVFLIPTVIQEVLQGASSADRLAAWQRVFDTFRCLMVVHPEQTAVAAATLYARCRWVGVTPRNGNDCLIAATCIELSQPLLHNDADFMRIASVEPRLKLLEPTC